jgi:hypothetical protein
MKAELSDYQCCNDIEITTRDEQIDGTWCDVPYVTVRKSEFDAFMAAHKRLVREATRVSSTMCDLDLAEALEDLRELEERT